MFITRRGDVENGHYAKFGNGLYGNAIYGKAIYGKAIYGKAIYGKAIWQCHMAAAAAVAAAAAALRCNGRPETFFRSFTLEKVILQIEKILKKRMKILYRTPYLKIRDLFSRASFDCFLFSRNMCINPY